MNPWEEAAQGGGGVSAPPWEEAQQQSPVLQQDETLTKAIGQLGKEGQLRQQGMAMAGDPSQGLRDVVQSFVPRPPTELETKIAATEQAAGVQPVPRILQYLSGMHTGISSGLATPAKLGHGGLDFLLNLVGAQNTGLSKWNEDMLKQYALRDQSLIGKDIQTFGNDTFFSQLGRGTGQAAVEMPLYIAPGMGAATPAQAALRSTIAEGAVGGGLQYTQDRQEGVDPLRAGFRGLTSGLITAATQGAFGARGVQSIFGDEVVMGLKNQIAKVLRETGFEGTKEAFDQVGQDILERVTSNPGKPLGDTVNEVVQAALVGGTLGAAATTGQTVMQEAGDASGNAAFNRGLQAMANEIARLGTLPQEGPPGTMMFNREQDQSFGPPAEEQGPLPQQQGPFLNQQGPLELIGPVDLVGPQVSPLGQMVQPGTEQVGPLEQGKTKVTPWEEAQQVMTGTGTTETAPVVEPPTPVQPPVGGETAPVQPPTGQTLTQEEAEKLGVAIDQEDFANFRHGLLNVSQLTKHPNLTKEQRDAFLAEGDALLKEYLNEGDFESAMAKIEELRQRVVEASKKAPTPVVPPTPPIAPVTPPTPVAPKPVETTTATTPPVTPVAKPDWVRVIETMVRSGTANEGHKERLAKWYAANKVDTVQQAATKPTPVRAPSEYTDSYSTIPDEALKAMGVEHGKSAADVLEKVAESSASDANSVLAKFLLTHFKPALVASKIDLQTPSHQPGRPFYTHRQHTINGLKGASARLTLPYYLTHEAAHAATVFAISEARTPKAKQAKQALEKLRHLATITETKKSKSLKGFERTGHEYYLQNVDEFIAGIFSSQNFRDHLNEIKVGNQTALEKAIQWIADALGIERGSALEAALNEMIKAEQTSMAEFKQGRESRGMGEVPPLVTATKFSKPKTTTKPKKTTKQQEFNALSESAREQQQNSPEFKKWFEGSKVVDENGKPLVVYHGTDSKEAFNMFARFAEKDYGFHGQGYYFSVDPEVAENYSRRWKEPGYSIGGIYPVYLSIKNPADTKTLLELFPGTYKNGQFVSKEASRKATEKLKSLGYDGVYVEQGNLSASEIVAFYANQIKSATGNQGTFSEEDPDIRHALQPGQDPLPFRYKDYATEKREATTARGIGQYKYLGRIFDPRSYKTSPEEQVILANGIAKQKADSGVATWLERMKNTERGFVVDDEGRVTLADGSKSYMSDVIEAEIANPGSQPLTQQQKDFVDTWKAINEEGIRYAAANGVKFFLDDQGNVTKIDDPHFPRPRIGTYGKEDPNRSINTGQKPGSQPGSFKERYHETEREGVDADVKYEPDEYNRVAEWLRAVYRSVADAKLAKDPNLKGRLGVRLVPSGVLSPGGQPTYMLVGTGPKYGEGEVLGVPALKGRVFSSDTARKLQEFFSQGTPNAFRHMVAANNLMKAVKFTMDVSAPFNQGLAMMGMRPGRWAKATVLSYMSLLDDVTGRNTLSTYLNKPENKAAAREFIESGGSLTRLQDFLAGGEKGQLAERIPIAGKAIKASARSMGTFLTIAKIELYKSLKPMLNGDVTKQAELAEVVDNAVFSGRMEQIGLTQGRALVERLLVNAPSYLRAAANLAAGIGNGGIQTKVGIQALGGLMGSTAMLMLASYKMQGLSDEEIKERFDPRSSKFMRISMPMADGKSVEMGFGNFFISLSRLIGDIAEIGQGTKTLGSGTKKNPVIRWLAARESPFINWLYQMRSGTDFMGRELSPLENTGRLIAPIPLEPLLSKALKDEGTWGTAAAETAAQFAGLNAFAKERPSMEEQARKKFGKSVEQLTIKERFQLKKDVEALGKPTLAEQERASLAATENEFERRRQIERSLPSEQREFLKENKLQLPAFQSGFEVKGTRVPLSSDEMQQHQQYVSEEYAKSIKALMESPRVQEFLKDGSLQRRLNLVLQGANTRARAKVRRDARTPEAK